MSETLFAIVVIPLLLFVALIADCLVGAGLTIYTQHDHYQSFDLAPLPGSPIDHPIYVAETGTGASMKLTFAWHQDGLEYTDQIDASTVKFSQNATHPYLVEYAGCSVVPKIAPCMSRRVQDSYVEINVPPGVVKSGTVN